MPPRAARIVLRTVGVAIVACACNGLLYNGASLFAAASGAIDPVTFPEPVPYLYEAFYTLSALCVASYIALLISGAQFIRLSFSLWWLLPAALAIEGGLYFLTGRLWLHPEYGMSIAAATGIAEGGLVVIFFTFLPLWAPILVLVAWHSLRRL
jgi:hypothetical protein